MQLVSELLISSIHQFVGIAIQGSVVPTFSSSEDATLDWIALPRCCFHTD